MKFDLYIRKEAKLDYIYLATVKASSRHRAKKMIKQNFYRAFATKHKFSIYKYVVNLIGYLIK